MRFFRIASLLIVWGVTIAIFRPAIAQAECITSSPQSIPGAIAPPPIPDQLIINEVLPSPGTLWNCQQANSTNPTMHAWIEIYNPHNQNYDLSHASLDNGPNTQNFLFANGSSIAAQSYLVIFPGNVYAPPGQSLQIRLLLNDQVIQNITIPSMPINFSYARQHDGDSTWLTTEQPTIQATNNTGPLMTATYVASPSATTTGPTPTSTTEKKPASTPTGTATPLNQKPVFGDQPTWQALVISNSQQSGNTSIPGSTPIQKPPTASMETPLWLKIAMSSLLFLFVTVLFWSFKIFFFPRFRWRLLWQGEEDNSQSASYNKTDF